MRGKTASLLSTSVSARLALALCAGLTGVGSGCASYAHAARGPGPNYSQLPIDATTPVDSTRWSFFWGLKSSLWSPLNCVQTDPVTQECKRAVDPCDGNGVGKVDMDLAWYSVPLAVLTLGMAVPSHIKFYCSTLRPPSTGP